MEAGAEAEAGVGAPRLGAGELTVQVLPLWDAQRLARRLRVRRPPQQHHSREEGIEPPSFLRPDASLRLRTSGCAPQTPASGRLRETQAWLLCGRLSRWASLRVPSGQFESKTRAPSFTHCSYR